MSGAKPMKGRLSYANVMATLALFVALGGVGYAAVKLPRNSVGPKQIKEDAVKASELAPDSVDSFNVIDGSIAGNDILPNTIGGNQIAGGAIGSAEIGDGSVNEAKLNTPATFTSGGLPDALGTCAGVGDNWGSFSPDVNNTVSYYRDPFGIVHLRGVAIRCNSAGLIVFNLPAGYRPDRQNIESVWTSAAIAQRLQIDGSGNVNVLASFSPGSWLSLDGVTFRCGPSGANGCP